MVLQPYVAGDQRCWSHSRNQEEVDPRVVAVVVVVEVLDVGQKSQEEEEVRCLDMKKFDEDLDRSMLLEVVELAVDAVVVVVFVVVVVVVVVVVALPKASSGKNHCLHSRPGEFEVAVEEEIVFADKGQLAEFWAAYQVYQVMKKASVKALPLLEQTQLVLAEMIAEAEAEAEAAAAAADDDDVMQQHLLQRMAEERKT